jgi:hypothetical protein
MRPEPFRELDWEPKRARGAGERALYLWQELLERLPELPVRSGIPFSETQRAMTLKILVSGGTMAGHTLSLPVKVLG